MEQSYFYGTGKRKTAIAAVRLYPGNGQVTINGKAVAEVFPRLALQVAIQQPFTVTETQGKFNVVAKVQGGGVSAQADAVAHGIARALVQSSEELRPLLRRTTLLTRDARIKERKKYGLKRARKAPQYTKR
ncbi:MAG: 30S ribosomal protein S9 [Chloroflexi bacterium]|nr:30S ribosomal protein S9 [Chloroflexota bacterium]MCL5026619.1 30S ribosomal protein S9 [Chloroflexota bacterium]